MGDRQFILVIFASCLFFIMIVSPPNKSKCRLFKRVLFFILVTVVVVRVLFPSKRLIASSAAGSFAKRVGKKIAKKSSVRNALARFAKNSVKNTNKRAVSNAGTKFGAAYHDTTPLKFNKNSSGYYNP